MVHKCGKKVAQNHLKKRGPKAIKRAPRGRNLGDFAGKWPQNCVFGRFSLQKGKIALSKNGLFFAPPGQILAKMGQNR